MLHFYTPIYCLKFSSNNVIFLRPFGVTFITVLLHCEPPKLSCSSLPPPLCSCCNLISFFCSNHLASESAAAALWLTSTAISGISWRLEAEARSCLPTVSLINPSSAFASFARFVWSEQKKRCLVAPRRGNQCSINLANLGNKCFHRHCWDCVIQCIFPTMKMARRAITLLRPPAFAFWQLGDFFNNEESELFSSPSRSTPILSLPLILPQVDSKLVQALHSFVSHTAIFLSCKKRNHLQVRASKVSSKNDWEKEKRAKVIIIWGQAEL